jgi:hypothetical protein
MQLLGHGDSATATNRTSRVMFTTGPFFASSCDAHSAPLEGDDVAELQLPPAAAINLAVHAYEPVRDGLFHVPTRVEESSELQELPEANALTTDGHVFDGSRIVIPEC